MATLNEVARIALALPEVTQAARKTRPDALAWAVGGKIFAWERVFSKADLKRFGDQTPPDGPILAVVTADLADKEAVLQAGHAGIFTIPHFDGYSAVLVQLSAVTRPVLRQTLVDGWLAAAPRAVAQAYLNQRRR